VPFKEGVAEKHVRETWTNEEEKRLQRYGDRRAAFRRKIEAKARMGDVVAAECLLTEFKMTVPPWTEAKPGTLEIAPWKVIPKGMIM
jgi:hypothetical protein